MSGLRTSQDCADLRKLVQQRKAKRERLRLAPPLVRLWDGDYRLRGVVTGERDLEFEWIENDVGVAVLQLSLDRWDSKWLMNFRGREKRNVHITIDKQGARWSGYMDHYKVVRTETGDAYLEITFLHDYAQALHIYVWCNPFLPCTVQFPKLWIIFGPAKWCLLMTLFVNILRLEASPWALPDDPLDPREWFPLSLDVSNWRNIVKPFDILSDNSNTTVVFSRFRSWHDTAQKILQDAQLTVVCRRYLKGDGYDDEDDDKHPFDDLLKSLGSDVAGKVEDLIPIRHGCLVWDIVDNSGWGTETAFGGSLLTGLVRAVVNIAADGYTEGVDIFTGDPTFPGEYYQPGFLGTNPRAPWVVFEEGPLTGIKSSEFEYHEAGATSFLTGGVSMPGVNESLSAAVNMGGDFLTSLINSAIPVVAWGGGFQLSIPSLGGVMDAVAKVFYENVFMAFMEVPTLRAIGSKLPLSGLENQATGLGDFHLFEDWGDGVERAWTLAATMAIRAKIWATRARTVHTLKISDAAPYIIGEPGYGHFWLGNRVGSTVLGFPDPNTIFVERVQRLKWKTNKGWEITIGHLPAADPALKALEWIKDINGGLSQVGIL